MARLLLLLLPEKEVPLPFFFPYNFFFSSFGVLGNKSSNIAINVFFLTPKPSAAPHPPKQSSLQVPGMIPHGDKYGGMV